MFFFLILMSKVLSQKFFEDCNFMICVWTHQKVCYQKYLSLTLEPGLMVGPLGVSDFAFCSHTANLPFNFGIV